MDNEKFLITRDVEDESRETIKEFFGSEKEAWEEFNSIIHDQSVEYRSGRLSKWQVLRMFNSEGKQIGQES